MARRLSLRRDASPRRPLLVAAGLAGSAGGARTSASRRAEGRHAPHRRPPTSISSIRRSPTSRDAWLIQDATCARLFDYPDAAGAGGWRVIPEVVDRYTVSQRRPDVHLHAEEDVPLPHRRPGDRAELRRRVQSDREARRLAFAGSGLHARDRRRRRGNRRQGAVDLRRPRARPLPPADPADQTCRRLHRPADDAVLLPDPAEHARRPDGIDNPAGSGPYYVAEHVREPAHRAEAQPVLPRRTPANVDQMVWTTGESVEACLLAVEQDRVDLCGHPGALRDVLARARREVRHQPPGGQFFVGPSLATWFARLQPRSPRVPGTGPDPAQEGDQLRDRPTGDGAPVRLPRRQAHRSDAPARARAPREHLPTRRRRRRRGAALVARATLRPSEARALHVSTFRRASRSPRSSRSTSGRSASTSRSSTSRSTSLAEKAGDAR